ncbi:excinuclease ABC subunit A, partial [Akkermansiaceae bacterium]|nr:excinuclease ABC subunit A [Akkermansiaceae bacterium]
KNTPYEKATGFDVFKYRYEVDQSPIGKTSRSCPATYVKLFDHIRALFAQLPESRMRGYTASRFSFNNKEGQCSECKGNGRIKLEMDFLPTTWIDCEACNGNRYNPATLEVFYNGKNIGDLLCMNITTAAAFFEAHPKLQRPLQLLADTGLGYLSLGQPSPTLSGGEAQRLKLVTQLIKGRPKITDMGATNTNLYLIEEPTIGLHQQDVARLIDVLHRLVDEGHTVVVIEHHMDLAAEADHIIDIGPEAGPKGGKIIAQGTPEEVAKSKKSLTAPFLAATL